jgi:hypothetical protein
MKLTKIVFRGPVSGIFGESVSSLGIEASPTVRSVSELELTPLGLVVTRVDGERRIVPLHDLGTGEIEATEPQEETAPAPQRGPRQKAR